MRRGRYWCANDERQMLGRSWGRDLERPIKMSREEIYRPPLFPPMSTLSAIGMICVFK